MAIEQFINQHGNRKPILIKKMQHHTYLKHMLQIQTKLEKLNSIIKHYQLTQFDGACRFR